MASPRLNTSQRGTASPAPPAPPAALVVAVVSSMSATRPTSTTQTGCDNVGQHGWQAKSPCLLCGHEPCAPSRTGWQRRRGSQSDLIASGRPECRRWEVMEEGGVVISNAGGSLAIPPRQKEHTRAHTQETKKLLPFFGGGAGGRCLMPATTNLGF